MLNSECSSRGESEAGGYFKLDEGSGHFDCIKRIKVNKGFRVRMFPMSSKTNFEVEILECCDRTKSPLPAFVRNLEVYISKENEIEVKIDAKSAPLVIQWWRVCGGILDGNTGKMIGPDHASGYPENQTCIWNITVQNGYMMSFTLNVDDYNGKNNCSLDYIQVEEWKNEETISKDRICSGILTLKLNKSLRIIFQSDNDPATGLSFNASWISKCGENFYADNGELASPDIPVDFNSQVQCNWTISVSPGHTIVLNYTFPKTSNEEAGCMSYVQVKEADSNASKILCKSSKFAVHKSSFHTLHIFFMYEPGMNYTRFYAKWHSEAQRHKDKERLCQMHSSLLLMFMSFRFVNYYVRFIGRDKKKNLTALSPKIESQLYKEKLHLV
ncbi:hypothetical protein CHS0354_015456 [Potamilus streckersoni]|uniref:CUB domain-containing protein n=1 Tax=Potamilus streckersoni TaxID=2493646 RepID=A0AAE0RR17_9BIVA|nr:hypothetical protein CHS0354_015456 [Potamilus streckersoni]